MSEPDSDPSIQNRQGIISESKTRVLLFGAAVALFSFASCAMATGGVSITSDTNVLLSGSGITLTLASGSTVVSYSADANSLTLNLDSSSSVTVKSISLYTLSNSQNQTTQCSGTNYSYVTFTAGSPATITVTPTTTVPCPPSSGGGGGGGGTSFSPLPVITSFAASPASIQPGQSSTLSWTITGGFRVSINPGVSSTTLNALSGTFSVSPASTAAYTLTAFNSTGQSASTSTTVMVLGSSGLPVPQTTSTSAFCLVNNSGTFSLILSGIRHGIANSGLLYSYGYGFADAVSDSFQSLPSGSLLGPGDGALVKISADPTVYLISDGSTHGFTSATVFKALGYKFSSVLAAVFDA